MHGEIVFQKENNIWGQGQAQIKQAQHRSVNVPLGHERELRATAL